jgi:hypothetical protein
VIRTLAFLIVAAVIPQSPSRDAGVRMGTASISGIVIAAADK